MWWEQRHRIDSVQSCFLWERRIWIIFDETSRLAFNFCHMQLISFSFITSFFAVPLSVSVSPPNNTDANVIETPGAPSASWSLASVPANPSPGSNFPGTKLQGPQLSSLFSNNSGTECECVSDWMVMSVPETEPQYLPLILETHLFSRAKQILWSHFPVVDPLGFVTHTRYVNEEGG